MSGGGGRRDFFIDDGGGIGQPTPNRDAVGGGEFLSLQLCDGFGLTSSRFSDALLPIVDVAPEVQGGGGSDESTSAGRYGPPSLLQPPSASVDHACSWTTAYTSAAGSAGAGGGGLNGTTTIAGDPSYGTTCRRRVLAAGIEGPTGGEADERRDLSCLGGSRASRSSAFSELTSTHNAPWTSTPRNVGSGSSGRQPLVVAPIKGKPFKIDNGKR